MKNKDIRIETKQNLFKFRVAGIVEKDNKILVTKMRSNNFYCFPGGHVEFLEDSFSAAKRELNEELYFDFKIKKLLYIHENIFNENDRNFHELGFYFKCSPIKNSLKKNKITEQLNKGFTEDETFKEDIVWEEIDNGEKIYHHFKWIDIKDVFKYDIRPKQVIKNFVKDKNKFAHIYSKEC